MLTSCCVLSAELSRVKYHVDKAVAVISKIETEHLDYEAQLRRLQDVGQRFGPLMNRLDNSLPLIQQELNLPLRITDSGRPSSSSFSPFLLMQGPSPTTTTLSASLSTSSQPKLSSEAQNHDRKRASSSSYLGQSYDADADIDTSAHPAVCNPSPIIAAVKDYQSSPTTLYNDKGVEHKANLREIKATGEQRKDDGEEVPSAAGRVGHEVTSSTTIKYSATAGDNKGSESEVVDSSHRDDKLSSEMKDTTDGRTVVSTTCGSQQESQVCSIS